MKVENERRRLRTILDTIPVGVWVADRNGALVEANDLMVRIWNGKLSEQCGPEEQQSYKTACVHSMLLYEPEEGGMTRALFGGETTIGKVFDLLRPDGSRAIVLSSTAPIKNSTGVIEGAVGVLEDITNQKELEKEAIEEKERAELYLDLLTHDIANYNTAAMGYLQLAEARLKLREKENVVDSKTSASAQRQFRTDREHKRPENGGDQSRNKGDNRRLPDVGRDQRCL